VLVTSRRRLTALEDARTISLDTLPPQEAAGLLVRLAVRPGLSSADPAVAEITRRRETMLATLVSISRTMVNQPSTNTVGRTVKASEANACGEELENPSATSPLAREDR
jgi:hypothetical protein